MNKDIETLFAAASGTPAPASAPTPTGDSTPAAPTNDARPDWLKKLEDPNYDPFAMNFNTSSEPDPEPTPAAPEPTAEVTPEPVVEEQPNLTPEQLAQLDNERRAAEVAMETVLDKFYAIPDDIKTTLPDGVAEFLQKQQVKAHKAVVNHISAILNNIQQQVLPNLVNNIVQGQTKVVEAEKNFYQMFPQLSDSKYKKDILDAAQTLAPKLQGKTIQQRMTMIGSYVALINNLDPRPSNSSGSTSGAAPANTNTPPVPNAPVIPSRAAAATPQGGANNRNPAPKNADVASLFSLFNQ